MPLHNSSILTTREAADLLGVSVTTAQLWMESGTLPSWKTPGKHRRCRRSDVENLLAADKAPILLTEDFVAPRCPDYPVAPFEQQRLQALCASGLVGSDPDSVFDRVAWLASEVTDCPIALVSLLTATRQWFKARVGLQVQETARGVAFCSHTILTSKGMVVNDATLDPRFAANPLVTGEPNIRFYAGVPVIDAFNNRLGTLCVIDDKPRQLSPSQVRALKELSTILSTEIGRLDRRVR